MFVSSDALLTWEKGCDIVFDWIKVWACGGKNFDTVCSMRSEGKGQLPGNQISVQFGSKWTDQFR